MSAASIPLDGFGDEGREPALNGIVAEAERSVLAGMLLGTEAVGRAVELIDASAFYRTAHQKIFDAIVALYNRSERADSITVTEELRKRHDLGVVGGPATLACILECAGTSANIEEHCRIVADHARNRDARRSVLELQAAIERDPDRAADTLERMVSAHPRDRGLGGNHLAFTTAADLASASTAEVPWIAPPWVARGCVTELVGKVKVAGKTTLVGALVRQVLNGAEFLGQPTVQTKVLWLTEQPATSFRQVLRRAGLEHREDLLVLPWHATRGTSWADVAQAAVRRAREFGAGLLVVDTLGQFAGLAGDTENSAGDALRAVEPLQVAAAGGLGVMIARHERKGGGDVGESGRGSSAFAGAVDIVLALRRPEGAQRPSVRVIHGLSRFDETPTELMIELVGDKYIALGTVRDLAMLEARTAILAECPDDPAQAASLDAILKRLPRVSRSTAQRALDSLFEGGSVAITGTGKRGDPRRFYRGNGFCPNPLSIGGRNESGAEAMVCAQTPACLGRNESDEGLP